MSGSIRSIKITTTTTTTTRTGPTTKKQQQQQQLLLLLSRFTALLLCHLLSITALTIPPNRNQVMITTATTTTKTTKFMPTVTASSSVLTSSRNCDDDDDDDDGDDDDKNESNENKKYNNPLIIDPLLTIIPQQVCDVVLSQSSSYSYSSSMSSFPSKLAYPFWYDPHPIAKFAANELKKELKRELPLYDNNDRNCNNSNHNQETTIAETAVVATNDNDNDNTITFGKMYGVLVVHFDHAENNNDSTSSSNSSEGQSTKKKKNIQLGYLKAYSGTAPISQYCGSTTKGEDNRFVPLVYDRFAESSSTNTTTTTDDDDSGRFCYVNEEEILKNLTKEIDKLENYCPQRLDELKRLNGIKIGLLKQLTETKKQQKNNKRNRKQRRDQFRGQYTENSNNINNNNNKDSHKYFLEHNQEYRLLEDQLVEESAYYQRQFKTLKLDVLKKLEDIQNSIDEYEGQIQALKQQRKDGSMNLQRKLFNQYKLLNTAGEIKNLFEIFKGTPLEIPPSGAGDCAAIKLFQYAFRNGYRPVALAEFWWGPSPHNNDQEQEQEQDNRVYGSDESEYSSQVARTHGNYYPCCRGKCEPILTRHMLLGIDVESDPLTVGVSKKRRRQQQVLSIVYEDDWLIVLNKPENVLSVPGKHIKDSIYTELLKRYPNATGPLLVHRLDYSTSGLLLAAKDSDTHKKIQAQFIERTVRKRYTALLEGKLPQQKINNNNHYTANNNNKKKGIIDLPLAGDYLHRPMQKVERGPEGKSAVTHYDITDDGEDSSAIGNDDDDGDGKNESKKSSNGRTRIHFYPVTGRTHQLRVHASHPEGLGIAIVGDDIYGQRDQRLCLHAGLLQINHPKTGKRITFTTPIPF